jgi:hypothetical protein
MKNTLSPQEIIDLNERWVNYTLEEQTLAVNFLQNLYPDKKQILKEAKWWNTVGDVLGIFDPTGVVDLINGLDYIRQGDYFYGFLSMIAVVPYVGDDVKGRGENNFLFSPQFLTDKASGLSRVSPGRWPAIPHLRGRHCAPLSHPRRPHRPLVQRPQTRVQPHQAYGKNAT